MIRFVPLCTAFVVCAGLATAPLARSTPVLIWNASPSVPIGLYIVEKRRPDIGEIAILHPPESASALANERGYLPTSAFLLKPVFARKGDIVCRFGRFVFVDGHLRGTALRHDRMKRALPSWRGCLTLGSTQIFVVSRHKDSFDSRYFGPVDERNVMGVGRLIFSPSR
jgi:conjugative transfer signal peptidase TraF